MMSVNDTQCGGEEVRTSIGSPHCRACSAAHGHSTSSARVQHFQNGIQYRSSVCSICVMPGTHKCLPCRACVHMQVHMGVACYRGNCLLFLCCHAARGFFVMHNSRLIPYKSLHA
eukprot:1142960-Pelagomonas_calceolata.AAC.2